MPNTQKDIIPNIIQHVVDLTRVTLSVFLILLILFWAAQIFHYDTFIPFYGLITSLLNKFNSLFVTQTILQDSNNSIAYLAINIIILLVILSLISDIVKDMIKIYKKTKAEFIAESNKKLNEEIHEVYELHLKHSIQFLLLLKLDTRNDIFQNLAFYDPDYTAKLKAADDKMFAEIKDIIKSSIKCDYSDMGNNTVLYIKTPKQLNDVLIFLNSLLKKAEYRKSRLEYYISITTYTEKEEIKTALEEATKLQSLNCKNKTVCFQIVSDCLNTVSNNRFGAMVHGSYDNINNSVYELFEKDQ